ncbi:hypothetical protein ABHZ18_00165 [Bacteroides uniformis]|jgi:hypothetical protein|uniref:hypothetical protein n=1 Tax=Bacteroides uniformis TaxID=820 RepID=UPI00232B951D|nr:hypothetical protein [Bacteroides uniformis]MDC1874763.1 hypothetical protein [Bacteroides uniformis]
MKKIMLNDKYGLTQAVLEGRKTMTRRIIKCPETYKGRPVKGLRITGSKDIRLAVEMLVYNEECDDFVPMYIQPRYEIGEVIAVAQSYESLGMNPEIALNDKDGIGFYTKTKFAPGWKNKMFVRADLMPHHIRITNIKIERLQDISDEDCLREGVELNTRQYECDGTKYYCVRGLGYWRAIGCTNFNTPREAFAALIDKISGKGTWESNPYVFAYEFELID